MSYNAWYIKALNSGRKSGRYGLHHKKYRNSIFSHPDYTVGFGVAPNLRMAFADCTADREFHPALKI